MIYHESNEQSTIAGYLKKHYPNIPFETVVHEGKRTFAAQNRHKKQNSSDSFPDTRIYFPGQPTLMIENKKAGTKLTNLKGVIASHHLQDQYETHKRLFSDHIRVYFCVGVSEAIEVINNAAQGIFAPQQVFIDRVDNLTRMTNEKLERLGI